LRCSSARRMSASVPRFSASAIHLIETRIRRHACFRDTSLSRLSFDKMWALAV
jgi:hypothetical protein